MYDLEQDPRETRNLAGDAAYAGVFRELAARLKAFQENTRDPWVVKYAHE
jgi:N-sulfoglucosamine sulfohydrolase